MNSPYYQEHRINFPSESFLILVSANSFVDRWVQTFLLWEELLIFKTKCEAIDKLRRCWLTKQPNINILSLRVFSLKLIMSFNVMQYFSLLYT